MQVIIGYGLLFIFGICVSFYGKKRKRQYTKYLFILTVTMGICFISGGMEQLSETKMLLQQIQRNSAGEGFKDTPLILEIEDVLQQEYVVSVEEQQLTEQQSIEVFEQAKQELESVILGENKSLEQISDNLYIPSSLMQGLVSVSCTFEPYAFVNADGSIQWEHLETDREIVKVIAQMSCQNREAVHEFYLQLLTPELSQTEIVLREIEDRITKENQSQGKQYLDLPQEVNGIKINWYLIQDSIHIKILLLGLIVIICLYVYEKEKREQEEKENRKKLIMDYPNIVSQLSLLSGAGLPISTAWEKMAQEYKKKKDLKGMVEQPGYEELLKTWYEMQDGVGELKAYENFGIRCGLPQYRKFASLLMQNTRKGSKGMQQLLDLEAKEAFRQRKLYAKQLGEEAGTKLLIPMGIMLILVFGILMIPAMLSLNIGL